MPLHISRAWTPAPNITSLVPVQALRLFNALPISNQDGPVDETDWNPVSRTEPAAFDVSNNKWVQMVLIHNILTFTRQ